MINWLDYNKSDDIVLSTRIRLARNISDYPFPHKLNEDVAKGIVANISNSIGEEFEQKNMWEIDGKEKNQLLERNLISSNLIKNSNKSSLLVDKNEIVSMMINEEDHMRIQCIVGGFNLNDAFKKANNLDDELGKNIKFAFDEKLGYLTACPTNLGTGLRASVMLHIPALCINNEIPGVITSLQKIGMTIRGWHGEGSKALGNIFQISNQLTLGFTEEEILDNFKGVVNEIIIKELNIREKMKLNLKWEFDDKVFRALGILKNAILIAKNEAIQLLSDVRFGVEMEIIKDIEKSTLNRLLIEIQPSTLEKIYNSTFNSRERDFHRARLIKERLK